MKYNSIVYVLRTDKARWSRGTSLKEAAERLLKIGSGRRERVSITTVLNDPEPFVDYYGSICYGGAEAPEGVALPAVVAGTLGDILKTNKE